MQELHTAIGRELTWQQPRLLEREYELRAGDELLATLRWVRRLGTLALAETARERWTFKRAGFWRPRVTVRAEGTDADLATFEANWSGGGTLATGDGQHYQWRAANFWHTKWHWTDAAGTPLVQFSSSQILKQSARVEVTQAGADVPDLALLATLGWYLLILLVDDGNATAGASVATTATTS
jgi:hypothetical protein